MKTVIIGGVAGGASAAARLRRLDEQAEIVIIERGDFISFANCGLPYYIGNEITERKKLILQTPDSFSSRFNVDVRIKNQVLSIDRPARRLLVRDLTTGSEYAESYDKLILSTGARPMDAGIPGADLEGVFRLRDIPDADNIKEYIAANHCRSAVVVGGSFIGLETADNLLAAGLDVTVVERLDHLIAPLDYDMGKEAGRLIANAGLRILLEQSVTSIQREDGRLAAILGQRKLMADVIVLAIGVRPESELAEAAGLAINSRGAVITAPLMRTSDPDIYAVGDVTESLNSIDGSRGYSPLAGPANKQGRLAADAICGLPVAYRGSQGSAILKFDGLTIAVTGINEETAKLRGLDYDKVYTYSPSHAGYYPGGKDMSIKTVFERRTGRILGAQIIGYSGVDKRCDVLSTAISAQMTGEDLTRLDLCYAPPFSSAKDPVNMVGFVIENVLSGRVKQFFWQDVAALSGDEGVTLLDVRTDAEVSQGMIAGALHIPLHQLRQRLGELPQDKPVYVNCKSGQRSYIACRILAGHGFDCYNLAGGYRFYSIMAGLD